MIGVLEEAKVAVIDVSDGRVGGSTHRAYSVLGGAQFNRVAYSVTWALRCDTTDGTVVTL
ncbi:uncharacterized protein G2W53_041819 [Senna tora]|uniref:Uncharacterized protein n=1 Tax=Senna tora TaxID=362788 RepID=A0A834SI23_9FABA|nr:uncharacterized protein G2W53_041819 [Senna tora]